MDHQSQTAVNLIEDTQIDNQNQNSKKDLDGRMPKKMGNVS